MQVQQQRGQLLGKFRERRGSEDLAGILSAVTRVTGKGSKGDQGDAIRRLSREEHEVSLSPPLLPISLVLYASSPFKVHLMLSRQQYDARREGEQ